MCSLLNGPPESIDGYRRGEAVPKCMHLHSIVNNLFGHVSISVSQKFQVVLVVSVNEEAVEHLLFISNHSNLPFLKWIKTLIRALLRSLLFRRASFRDMPEYFQLGVKDHMYVLWFLWVKDSKSWQIPTLLIFF